LWADRDKHKIPILFVVNPCGVNISYKEFRYLVERL